MKLIKYLLIVIIVFSGCKEKLNEPEKSTTHSVSGKLLYKGSPLKGAAVSLDEKLNYSAESDETGFFEIKNVDEGSHSIKVSKSFDDGTFLEKTSSLDVNDDIFLDALKLPKTVLMYQPGNTTSTSSRLTWSATDAADFREYKVYRNLTAGIDENNGELVYVATSINDTSFIDNNLNPVTNYYYRVFVMNEFGRLGGSNIVTTKTENLNLITNGDFEEIGSDSLPTDWEFRNDVFKPVESNDAQSGNHYLLGETNKYVSDLGWGSLQYRLSYTKLIPGKEYVLSFWYYIEALPGNSCLNIRFNPEQTSFLYSTIIGAHSEIWQKFEKIFTAPADINNDFYLRFEVSVNIPYNNEPWKVRIDNVSLKTK